MRTLSRLRHFYTAAWQTPFGQFIEKRPLVKELVAPVAFLIVISWVLIKSRNQISDWPFSLQLTVWPIITTLVYFTFKVVGVPSLPKHLRTPEQLGWIRICTTLALLVLAFKDDILTTLILPEEYAYYWYGPLAKLYQSFPSFFPFREALFLSIIQWGTRISLILACLGIFTRLTLPLSLLFYLNFYFIQIVYTHFYSSGYLPLIILFFLCLIPCDALSVQAYWRSRKRSNEPTTTRQDYAPAVFACFAAYAISYFVCALSKWRLDQYWAASNNMKKYLAGDSAALIDNVFGLDLTPTYVQLGGPDWVFFFLGTFALLAETSALLILFSNWARYIVPVLLASFHIGTFFFQKFIFPELVVLSMMFFPIRFVLSEKSRSLMGEKTTPRLSTVLASCFMVAHVLSGWLTNHKIYPTSNTWNMYASSGYAEKTWFNFYYLTLKNGDQVKTDLTDQIQFLGQAKWHSISYWPRNDQEEQRLVKLFENYALEFNRHKEPERQIKSIEMVHWIWDFVNDPSNPNHGNPDKILSYDLTTKELSKPPVSSFHYK